MRGWRLGSSGCRELGPGRSVLKLASWQDAARPATALVNASLFTDRVTQETDEAGGGGRGGFHGPMIVLAPQARSLRRE